MAMLSDGLPERLRALDVCIADHAHAGQLLKTSVYEFRYLDAVPDQPAVALLMPASERLTWQDGDLFAPMDQNLPEGDLFMRIRQLFPKQPMTPMHLLALVGRSGIGRLGYRQPGAPGLASPPPMGKDALLKTRYSPKVFDELVAAYLSTGAGIAGMQPKIMVPDRPTVPIPSLIVKAASPAYPGLCANEFLCLGAAQRAGIEVPGFALSDDGQIAGRLLGDGAQRRRPPEELWRAVPERGRHLAGADVRRGDHGHLHLHPLPRRP